jgi:cytochrome c
MKRWLSLTTAALLIISAGLSLAADTPITKTPATRTQNTQASDAEDLAKKRGCLECHSVDKKVVGPAFQDIAARYKENSNARAALIEKVRKGGKGNWTEITRGVPMPPHSGRLSTADITRLVDWVLSLHGEDAK